MDVHAADYYLRTGLLIRRASWPPNRFLRRCACGQCDRIFDSFCLLPEPSDIQAEDWETVGQLQ